MSSADDIQAMLDDVYGVSGVACTWTPAGGAPLGVTVLLYGDDQSAALPYRTVGEVNVSQRQVRLRVSEAAAVAPGVTPAGGSAGEADGDQVQLPDGAFRIIGDPVKCGSRRLEWLLDLDEA